MDKGTQQRLDSILEDEVRLGFRIKTVPAPLQRLLKEYGLPVIERVRFSRLNPGRKRRIGELVQQRYHKDLQDENILSEAQLLELEEKRGGWSRDESTRLNTLRDEVNALQYALYLEGATTSSWDKDFMDEVAKFRVYIEEAYEKESSEKVKEIHDVFDRWAEYTPDRAAFYKDKYAAAQGREEYSPDRDLAWLYDQCPHPAAGECLNKIEDVKDKLVRFMELSKKKVEWAELREKHARVFSESVEARRDNTESMARAYHCAEKIDETGRGVGPVTKTFDDLWELPDPVIQWFLVETFMFLNGRTDADRDYFAALGFPVAEGEKSEATSETTASEPSVASPVPPISKVDSQPSVATLATSTA